MATLCAVVRYEGVLIPIVSPRKREGRQASDKLTQASQMPNTGLGWLGLQPPKATVPLYPHYAGIARLYSSVFEQHSELKRDDDHSRVAETPGVAQYLPACLGSIVTWPMELLYMCRHKGSRYSGLIIF